MIELPALREALAVRLRTVEPLTGQRRPQVESKLKAMVTPPTLMVAYPEKVDYHHQSGYGADFTMVILGIGAAGAYDEAAQNQVDAWLNTHGAASVRNALESDTTLDGLVEDVTVLDSDGYNVFTVDGTPYLGAQWRVQILG